MKEVIFWVERKAKLEQNGCLWSAGTVKEGLQGTRLERTWDPTVSERGLELHSVGNGSH